MSQPPAAKKARVANPSSHPQYELLYHPGIPGRGEFIRLVFEAAGVGYTDVGNDKSAGGYSKVQKICMSGDGDSLSSADGNPPMFAPPALRVPGQQHEEALIISQTPNILAYLGERTGLDGGGEPTKWHVAQVALTALDLNNEIHDTHHPIAVMKYYEDQKPEALKKATDVRENRLPKYFSYFTRTLEYNRQNGNEGQGKFLVGNDLTYADTTVWQVLDGLFFAFPKEMEERKKEFPDLLGGFYESVRQEKGLKEYLASDRRKPYSMGVFRNYPELDRQ